VPRTGAPTGACSRHVQQRSMYYYSRGIWVEHVHENYEVDEWTSSIHQGVRKMLSRHCDRSSFSKQKESVNFEDANLNLPTLTIYDLLKTGQFEFF